MTQFTKYLITVLLLSMATMLLSGCANNGDSANLQAELNRLQAELVTLQAEHNSLQANFAALQTTTNQSNSNIRWEYRVEHIISTGTISPEQLENTLNRVASEGWELHSSPATSVHIFKRIALNYN